METGLAAMNGTQPRPEPAEAGDQASNDPASNDPASNDPAGNDPASNDPAGDDLAGDGLAGDAIDLRDTGATAGRSSERTCVATRVTLPPDDLIRCVVAPDGVLVADLRRRLPGRGVWVALSREAVLLAIKRGAFPRSLKTKVTVSPDFADDIDRLMQRDALQSLAMANKAGLVTSGFAKVESEIGAGRVAALIEASDGAPDGQRKIAQATRRFHGDAAVSVPVVTSFTGGDLELALGRVHVIHAALAPGPAAEGFLHRWRRLVRYRTAPPPIRPGSAGP